MLYKLFYSIEKKGTSKFSLQGQELKTVDESKHKKNLQITHVYVYECKNMNYKLTTCKSVVQKEVATTK